jgi:hypothetical protein
VTTTDNAIQIISQARQRGALIYSAPNLNTPPLFKVEVTEISATPAEFHKLQGKFMPSKAVLDRIADAAGVNFIEGNCNVTTETRDDPIGGKRTVFIGRAQGKVRISDGSWREGTVEEYEFDPILRAKAEGGNESKQLEYMKVARARASTGARLRVIRQLTGMPVTFTEQELTKPLVFSRIVQNTDYILATPEGRQMAVATALGVNRNLYGMKPDQISAPSAPVEQPPRNVTGTGDDFDPTASAQPLENPFRSALKEALEKHRADLGPKAISAFETALADEHTTDQVFATFLKQTKDFLASKGIDLVVNMGGAA